MLLDEVLDTVRRLEEQGLTILLVEQDGRETLEISARAYHLQTGRITKHGPSKEFLHSDKIRKAFLGM
ncbi:MAG: hypothetical protein ACLP5H_31265 [Desulfomonilaceae bacterium]